MFCGNCGKEINDGATFCPECGVKTGITSSNNMAESKVYSRPKKINPKVKIASIILVVVVVLSVIGIKTIDYIQSIPSDSEIMLTANNLSNGAFATTDGKWLYYFDENGLCKEKLSNGKSKKYLSTEYKNGDVFFLGDKLYVETMSAFYTTNSQGKEFTEIPNTTFCENKFQTDGRNIYFDNFDADYGNGICSQKNDGSNIKEISDIAISKILFNGESIYAFSPFDTVNGESNLYKGVTIVDTDGKSERLILDFCPGNFVFGEGKIYYTKDNVLYCMNFDGTNQQQFGDIKVATGLNVCDGFIYYVDYSSRNICKVSVDNSSYSTVLNDCDSEYINIVGDWIFYNNTDDYSTYRMRLDGSENQLFLE